MTKIDRNFPLRAQEPGAILGLRTVMRSKCRCCGMLQRTDVKAPACEDEPLDLLARGNG